MEDLTVALLTGIVPQVHDRALTAALLGLLTVEARHAAWARHIVGTVPAPAAFDTPKTLHQVRGVLARTRFIAAAAEDDREAQAEVHGLMPRRRRRDDGKPWRSRCSARWRRSGLPRGRAVAGTPAAPAGAGALPLPVAPAFTPGRPRPLGSTRHLSHWATVKRPAIARVAPAAGAAVVAAVPTRAPEGTPSAVAVIAQRQDGGGRVWVHVRLPVLPNGTTGWVRRRALGGYETVDTRLDVDLARLRATLYRDGRPVLRAPVGVGSRGWPTPRGEFYVRNKLTRYRSPAYGPVAFGTSARSPAATGWPAGGFVGIHGTDRPDLCPAASRTGASACATPTSARSRGGCRSAHP